MKMSDEEVMNDFLKFIFPRITKKQYKRLVFETKNKE